MVLAALVALAALAVMVALVALATLPVLVALVALPAPTISGATLLVTSTPILEGGHLCKIQLWVHQTP